MTRARPWLRWVLSALGGAVVMVALGQVFALAGSSCAILCRPPIAALYGAVVGLLVVGSATRS